SFLRSWKGALTRGLGRCLLGGFFRRRFLGSSLGRGFLGCLLGRRFRGGFVTFRRALGRALLCRSRGARRLAGLGGARLEFEADLAVVLTNKEGLELAVGAARYEVLQQIRA